MYHCFENIFVCLLSICLLSVCLLLLYRRLENIYFFYYLSFVHCLLSMSRRLGNVFVCLFCLFALYSFVFCLCLVDLKICMYVSLFFMSDIRLSIVLNIVDLQYIYVCNCLFVFLCFVLCLIVLYPSA